MDNFPPDSCLAWKTSPWWQDRARQEFHNLALSLILDLAFHLAQGFTQVCVAITGKYVKWKFVKHVFRDLAVPAPGAQTRLVTQY